MMSSAVTGAENKRMARINGKAISFIVISPSGEIWLFFALPYSASGFSIAHP
jgi:hypothetical protein